MKGPRQLEGPCSWLQPGSHCLSRWRRGGGGPLADEWKGNKRRRRRRRAASGSREQRQHGGGSASTRTDEDVSTSGADSLPTSEPRRRGSLWVPSSLRLRMHPHERAERAERAEQKSSVNESSSAGAERRRTVKWSTNENGKLPPLVGPVQVHASEGGGGVMMDAPCPRRR